MTKHAKVAVETGREWAEREAEICADQNLKMGAWVHGTDSAARLLAAHIEPDDGILFDEEDCYALERAAEERWEQLRQKTTR